MPIASYDDAASQFLANVDYDVTGDAGKAALFVAACRSLLLFPSKSGRDGQDSEFDLVRVENLMVQAQQFLAANGTPTESQLLNNPSVLHADFSTFHNYRTDRVRP
jgi:hypothetical protein